MRLIDADELIKQGWVLTRHGVSNCLIGVKSIADVPTAFDIDVVLNQLNELDDAALEEYHNTQAGTYEHDFGLNDPLKIVIVQQQKQWLPSGVEVLLRKG